MSHRYPALSGVIALPLVLLTLIGVQANASTILQMDIDQVLAQSGLVFEGEVTSAEARWNSSRTSINTHIDFLVTEVILGSTDQSVISLRFSGGTVGDTTLEIDGVVYPAVGDKGIYFVLDTDRHYVNPLVGWSQGHFRIDRGVDDIERITTEDRSPVTGFEPRTVPGTTLRFSRQRLFSEGIAEKLITAPSRQSLTDAMSKSAFKQELRRRINAAARE